MILFYFFVTLDYAGGLVFAHIRPDEVFKI